MPDRLRPAGPVWPQTSQIWPDVDFSNNVLLLRDGERAWAIDREQLRAELIATRAELTVLRLRQAGKGIG